MIVCWNYGANIFHAAITSLTAFLLKILCILWFLGKSFDRSCTRSLPIFVYVLLEKKDWTRLFSMPICSYLYCCCFQHNANHYWSQYLLMHSDMILLSICDVSVSLFSIDFVNCFRILGGWFEFINICKLVIGFMVWLVNVVLQIKCNIWKIYSFQIAFCGDGESTLKVLTISFSFFLSLVLKFCEKFLVGWEWKPTSSKISSPS